MRSAILSLFVFLFGALLFSAPSARAEAQRTAKPLISPRHVKPASLKGGLAAEMVVDIDLSALVNDFSLELGGRKLSAQQNRMLRTTRIGQESTETISGYLRDDNQKRSGEYTISVAYGSDSQPGVFGVFHLDDGTLFVLNSDAAGNRVLREVDQSASPACHGTVPIVAPLQDLTSDSGETAPAYEFEAQESQIDLMVVYTPRSRLSAGGTSNMASLIAGAVDLSNTAYANSNVALRLNLVHTHELQRDETGTFDVDLQQLSNPNDGVWDEVAAMRSDYGADIVVLLVDALAYCGVAYLLNDIESRSSRDFAFAVVSHHCIGGLSFTHEVGHLLGADHDISHGSGGAFPFSFGQRFTGESGAEHRTIMAYMPGERINYFSNPDVPYDGKPTGDDTANNALTLNMTRSIVSSYRKPSSPGPVPPAEISDVELPVVQTQRVLALKKRGKNGRFSLVGTVTENNSPVLDHVDILRAPRVTRLKGAAEPAWRLTRRISSTPSGTFTVRGPLRPGKYKARLRYREDFVSRVVVIRGK